MARRLEVAYLEGVRDPLGEKTLKRIKSDLKIDGVESVRTAAVYTFADDLPDNEMELLGKELFADPIIQRFTVDKPIAAGFDYLVEVGYLPGVTDNVGRSAREGAQDVLRRTISPVYTSIQYLFTGSSANKDTVERVTRELLANGLIERWSIASKQEYEASGGFKAVTPKVELNHEPKVEGISLDIPDEELVKLSRNRTLVLSLEEMKIIQDYYNNDDVRSFREENGVGTEPTDVELECLAQTWSEHCKHKIFNARITYENEKGESEVIDSLFKTYIKRSTDEIGGEVDWLVSVFKDNAGVISFDEEWNLVMKVETHNSPSALDPYGGALTGIVGVNRDTIGTGIGSKPIFNTDVFCFAPPDYNKPLPPKLLHPKRVLEGVRKGVEDGGNNSGIPTVNGCLVFDDRFLGKPLVYCGTGGLMPREVNGKPSEVKEIDPGDLAVMVGGRIGADGIHGATFSSEALNEASPATAVQIGDPITQKKMSDFLLEARDRGLYKAITDNGAGGLSSSIGEMAEESGGCIIDLDKPPLKYPGLDPWEILISESQERMTLGVAPDKVAEFLELADEMEVEATVVGEFTDSGYFVCRYDDKPVAMLEMDFLHGGVPQMQLSAKWDPPKHEEPALGDSEDYTAALSSLLSRYNVCSKEYVVRQYDHEVQGGSVIKPLSGSENDGPSDSAVVKPVLGLNRGVVVSNGIAPRYGDIDAYHMTACVIDEAVRNHVASGGSLERIAGLDNFCWCDPVKSEKTPDGEFKLAQLVRANKALYDYTKAFQVPCISGKDSMKNDYIMGGVKISIPPTLLFSTIGIIEDVGKAVSIDFKSDGDLVYVLGATKSEMGGSEYYAMEGFVGNTVPEVDASSALARYKALHNAMSKGLVSSCHDCSDGGLAVALAESAFAGGLGLEADLSKAPFEGVTKDYELLFSESASRFVVSVKPGKKEEFEKELEGTTFAEVGVVKKDGSFKLKGLRGTFVVDSSASGLKQAWQAPMNW